MKPLALFRARSIAPIIIAPVIIALAIVATVVPAQVVTGIVTEVNGRTPVPGAIVSLVQGDNYRIAPALADESGHFTLQAPRPGAYRARADAVGFGTIQSEPVNIGVTDTARVMLALPVRSGALEAVRVIGETTCATDPAAGERTAAVWQEIRTALESSAAAERERRTPLALTVTDATLNTRLGVLTSSRVTVRSFSGGGFQTLSADDLASGGLVRALGDSVVYYAPDASVLTTDAFLSTHCFSVVERRRFLGSRELGLHFTPTKAQTVVEVEGTIWLDGRTAALKRIEIGYTNSPKDGGAVLGNAEVEFMRLPTGRWIVSKWWLRMPRVFNVDARRRGGAAGSAMLVGYRERRGEARVVTADELARTPEPAMLIGAVFDSTTGTRLAGAIARFATFNAQADEFGRFGFRVPNPAALPTPHHVSVWHPRLARLGLDSLQRDFDLQPGDTVRASFAIPSLATLRPSLCPKPADSTADEQHLPGTGIVIGRVLRADPAELAQVHATVEAMWWVDEKGQPQGVATKGRQSMHVQTGDGGRYAFCGLPLGVPITLKAQAAATMSDPVEVTLAEGWLGEEELTLLAAPSKTP